MSYHSQLMTRLAPAALLIATGVACEPRLDPASNCQVGYNGVAADPANKFSVRHEVPKSCPLTLVNGPEFTNYAATIFGDAYRVGTDVELDVRSPDDVQVGNNTSFFGPEGDGSLASAYLTGNYTAGTVQNAFGSTVLDDIAYNSTTMLDGQVASGWVFLTYDYAVLAARYPNTGATVGEAYSQEIRLTNYAHPAGTVSYEWLLDGESLGPSSPNGASVTTYFDEVSTHTLEVVATDATGASERWMSQVHVSYPDGCLQLPCEPTRP